MAVALGLLAASPAQAAYPGENGRIFFTSCGDPCGGSYNVYSMNPDGSDAVNLTGPLTAPAGPPDNAFTPSVSADGKRVAFGVDSQATAEIWIMNADGTSPLQLTNDNLLDQAPSISPDGTRVVWNQWSPFPSFGDRDIWVMNSDGSSQQLLFNGFQTDLLPQFTPDGQTVVMASETGDLDIRKIPSIPATPPLTAATGVAEDNNLLESDPAVSPDGNRVAFTQTPTGSPGGPFDIYSVSINGGATTPVYNAPGVSETDPTYSPDGTKMIFLSDGVPMVGNADGSGTPVPLNVGTLGFTIQFNWAPKAAVAPPPDGGGPGAADITPPNGRIGKHPKKKTTKRKAKFTFASDEAGSTFKCKLDKGAFRPCSSPFSKKVRPGRHRFQVEAIDAAGNVDPTPAAYKWKVLAS